MKKLLLKYSIALSFILVWGSCKDKEILDLTPKDAVSELLAYSSLQNIELSMVGVYDAAQSGFYGGSETNDRGYVFGAAHIEQGDMRGEDFVLVNIFYAFTYQATYTTSTANNTAYWENAFRIINSCNLMIDGVHGALAKGIISQAVSDSYEGEARLIRAMTYHTMLIHFARPYLDGAGSSLGIPIFTIGINGSAAADAAVKTGRSTVAECYNFILADLNFAETALAANRTDGFNWTRATKGAAIALKTRVYLHMGDYANVLTESDKLVTSVTAPFSGGGYALGASPDTPWANNKSSESIFGMEMSATDDLNTNAALARMIGTPVLAGSPNARGEYAISPIIWNQTWWDSQDLRRTLTVRSSGTRWYTHKYRDYTNWTDTAPIIRYAEVLLNRAEAEARLNGKTAKALNLLNGIRDRAKSGTMVSYALTDFATANDLVQSILNERRIELLGEGHRWSDIHRLAKDPNFSTNGIPAKMVISDVASLSAYTIGVPPTSFGIAAIPYSDFRFLWPIPLSETTRNATLAAQQNPGY